MYKEIIVNTFDTIFKNSNTLIQKLIIPTILISVISFYLPQFVSAELINNLNIQKINSQVPLLPFLLAFTLVMINISIAITTHRVAILGADSTPSFGSYILGLREFKFLFKSIAFAIVVAIPLILVAFIPVVGIFILPILAFILVSRLSLVFPAVSCDEKLGFFEAWKITKGHNFLSFFAVIIFPFIFALTVGIVYTLAIEFLIKLVSPHMVILYSILNVFIMVFSISALSSIYNYLYPRPMNKSLKDIDEPLREIIQSTRRGVHKVVIHDKYKVDIQSLIKELEDQYNKLGFKDVAYNRENAWLIRNPLDEEAYVSVRHENDEYTIHAKNTEEPCLKIIQKNKNKK